MRIDRFTCGLLFCLLSRICFADNGSEDNGADSRPFIKGSSVTVLLNYDAFLSTGIATDNPTLSRQKLESSIRIGIDRWVQVTGLNLKITYGGTTTKTSPSAGEILIGAVIEADKPGWFAASRNPSVTNDIVNGSCLIRFFKQSNSNQYNWHVFNFKDYPWGTVFFHAIFMHEFGHCLGLRHNENADGPDEIATLRTVMMSEPKPHASYGPFIEDVEDIIALYGSRPKVQFDVQSSTNSGQSWDSTSSNIPKLSMSQIPVVNRDDDRMVLAFTNSAHKPSYIMADTHGESWGGLTTFGGEESLYGTSVSGSDNEYMIAWVDPKNQNKVKIAYSDDAGAHWVNRSGVFRAASTPSIRKIERNIWIISYLYLDANPYKNENGRILSRVSTNDGLTWSSPVELVEGFRAIGGVTVTSMDRNNIRIGFVNTSDADDYSSTTIMSMNAHLDSNNVLVFDGLGVPQLKTTSEPSITMTKQSLLMGYKLSNNLLTSCYSDFDHLYWVQCSSAGFSNGLSPAVTGKTDSNWAYLFKEK